MAEMTAAEKRQARLDELAAARKEKLEAMATARAEAKAAAATAKAEAATAAKATAAATQRAEFGTVATKQGFGSAIDLIVRTATSSQDAIQKAIELAQKQFPNQTSTFIVEAALNSLQGAARQRASGQFVAAELDALLSGTDVGRSDPAVQNIRLNKVLANVVGNNKNLWAYKPEDVGKTIGNTLVLGPETMSLTPEQLKKLQAGELQVVNAATGRPFGLDVVTGKLWTTPGEAPYSSQYGVDAQGRPYVIGQSFLEPGKSWGWGQGAGLAYGTFTRIDENTWSEPSGGTTTNAGFARMMARFGFDASKVKSGETVTVGESGIQYGGKTFSFSAAINPVLGGTQTGAATSGMGYGSTGNMGAGVNVPFMGTLTPSQAARYSNLTSEEQRGVQNALAVLTERFNRYGLGSLVPKIRDLAIAGATEATITLQLQETQEYQQRFIGNQQRIRNGLSALTPGEYLGLEDQYRQILRAYGLRQFDNDNYVTQFISNDVSAAELSSRVVTAVQRVQNADPAISRTLRDYYGIGATDLVAYVLDPNQQLPKIERQVAAAEIGTAARRQGLEAGVNVAEQLAAQGITQAEAQRGYATIADILPQATKLSAIYTDVLDQYNQAEAEQEVFNSLASAQRKRRLLSEREIASFSGTSGLGRGALGSVTGGNI